MLAWPVCAVLFFVAGGLGRAAEPEAIAREVANNLHAQTELPSLPDPVDRKEREPLPSSDLRLRLPDDMASMVLWGAVIAALLVIGWTMRDSILQLLQRPVDVGTELQPQAPSSPISVERLEGAQLEADELASQGRFVEAMHVLLLRGLAELRRSFRLRFADSLTSRELLALLPLPQTTLQALTDIVERVELAYFGERVVVAGDYHACRESFDVLTATARGQAQGQAHG